ncbi:MAG: hypothetical protein OEZ06_25000 [Myxococcales bacterium]|nr:hypothetical protein [Myxococcales bacterium]
MASCADGLVALAVFAARPTPELPSQQRSSLKRWREENEQLCIEQKMKPKAIFRRLRERHADSFEETYAQVKCHFRRPQAPLANATEIVSQLFGAPPPPPSPPHPMQAAAAQTENPPEQPPDLSWTAYLLAGSALALVLLILVRQRGRRGGP